MIILDYERITNYFEWMTLRYYLYKNSQKQSEFFHKSFVFMTVERENDRMIVSSYYRYVQSLLQERDVIAHGPDRRAETQMTEAILSLIERFNRHPAVISCTNSVLWW